MTCVGVTSSYQITSKCALWKTVVSVKVIIAIMKQLDVKYFANIGDVYRCKHIIAG